jgi:hypothetical protein
LLSSISERRSRRQLRTLGLEVKDRYIILDVRGETVLIDVAPPERKFDEFLPRAQKVLYAVKWQE